MLMNMSRALAAAAAGAMRWALLIAAGGRRGRSGA
jgi:hypothetical protein